MNGEASHEAPTDLALELETFRAAHERLTFALNFARLGGFPDLAALGADVRDAIGLLRNLHDLARAQISEESAETERGRPPFPPREVIAAMSDEELGDFMRARLAAGPPPEEILAWVEESIAAQNAGRLPTGHFAVTFKMAFFALRAYQDAVCCVLLVAGGNRAGRRVSLNKHLNKPSSPVREVIDSNLPHYREWFARWKEFRDRVKYGAEFGLSQVGPRLGVVFAGIPADPENVIGLTTNLTLFLDDVVDALLHTTEIVDLACSVVSSQLSEEEREAVAKYA